MADGTGVLVVGEVKDGRLSPTTGELLNVGRKLADGVGQSLGAVVMGADLGNASREAIAYGAGTVLVAEHALLGEGHLDAHVVALEQVCRQAKPNIVLIARTEAGRELGPRLAFRLGVGLAQDAVALSVDDSSRQLRVTRPVYGGNAMAVVTMARTPQVVTVRPKAFEAAEKDESRRGEAAQIRVEIPSSAVKVRMVEKVVEQSTGNNLEGARVVVAGGRGLGGAEPFRQLAGLAQLFGGAVGASRPACDAGWLEHSYQVGLTGKIVTPDLYIAVGVSGASQHMAGCSGAKVIVAINNDPEANIFKEARYGVVGDWKKILPAFTETVRELLS
ncbi:MAG: electron transfer flavoprotein subunit alpha/FixB family protein [Deltaproteobacteria bacterium]|nr:electron transfer flavoprotein subunit alpha/FixB family protein [Deltaproteobacteria bacterium]